MKMVLQYYPQNTPDTPNERWIKLDHNSILLSDPILPEYIGVFQCPSVDFTPGVYPIFIPKVICFA